MTDYSDHDSASRSRLKSCALLALGPVVLLVALVVVFLVNNRPPNIAIPTHKVPQDNGWDYFLRAGKMKGMPGPSSDAVKQPGSWTVGELKQFVDGNAPALETVREGLKRECVLPPERSSRSFAFTDYSQIRELARKLADEGRYYETIGDYRRAADSRLDCVEMGAVLPRGGPLITGLVATAVGAIGLNRFHELIPRLDRAGLAHVAGRMERIDSRQVSYSDIIEEEGRVSAALLMEECRRPGYAASMANPVNWFNYGGIGCIAPSSAGEVWDGARCAFCNKSVAVQGYMDYCSALAKEARTKPYTGTSHLAVPGNAVIEIMCPVFDHARLAWEKSNAQRAVIQTEVAIRRYKLDHRYYPSRLSDVVPVYLKKVPIDPLGKGKPMRYRSLDGGSDFLLYSFGPNLKDDGGTPGSQSNSFRTGDIVAGKM